MTFEKIFFDIGTTGKPKGVEVGCNADFFLALRFKPL